MAVTDILNRAISIVGRNAMKELKLDETLEKTNKITSVEVVSSPENTKTLEKYREDELSVYDSFNTKLEEVLNITGGKTSMDK